MQHMRTIQMTDSSSMDDIQHKIGQDLWIRILQAAIDPLGNVTRFIYKLLCTKPHALLQHACKPAPCYTRWLEHPGRLDDSDLDHYIRHSNWKRITGSIVDWGRSRPCWWMQQTRLSCKECGKIIDQQSRSVFVRCYGSGWWDGATPDYIDLMDNQHATRPGAIPWSNPGLTMHHIYTPGSALAGNNVWGPHPGPWNPNEGNLIDDPQYSHMFPQEQYEIARANGGMDWRRTSYSPTPNVRIGSEPLPLVGYPNGGDRIDESTRVRPSERTTRARGHRNGPRHVRRVEVISREQVERRNRLREHRQIVYAASVHDDNIRKRTRRNNPPHLGYDDYLHPEQPREDPLMDSEADSTSSDIVSG